MHSNSLYGQIANCFFLIFAELIIPPKYTYGQELACLAAPKCAFSRGRWMQLSTSKFWNGHSYHSSLEFALMDTTLRTIMILNIPQGTHVCINWKCLPLCKDLQWRRNRSGWSGFGRWTNGPTLYRQRLLATPNPATHYIPNTKGGPSIQGSIYPGVHVSYDTGPLFCPTIIFIFPIDVFITCMMVFPYRPHALTLEC